METGAVMRMCLYQGKGFNPKRETARFCRSSYKDCVVMDFLDFLHFIVFHLNILLSWISLTSFTSLRLLDHITNYNFLIRKKQYLIIMAIPGKGFINGIGFSQRLS